eukprot:Hpha_TRINITY_DN32028_c0_g1::TRINITY_DN32028_c0_g1_i1::g.115810::m.115810
MRLRRLAFTHGEVTGFQHMISSPRRDPPGPTLGPPQRRTDDAGLAALRTGSGDAVDAVQLPLDIQPRRGLPSASWAKRAGGIDHRLDGFGIVCHTRERVAGWLDPAREPARGEAGGCPLRGEVGG